MTLTEFLLARIDEGEHAARVDRKPMAVDGWEWYADNFVAECEAKRRIVALMGSDRRMHYPRLHDRESACATCDTLRALALPYASHPGFDPSWTV